jgi:hypothetical protein
MIHIDPLFYKQTSPRFHVERRSLFYIIYIGYLETLPEILLMQTM